MTRVLLLGYDPDFVDFSDPGLPPGMTPEKVHAGIAVAMRQFAERGWEADVGLFRPDGAAGPAVERRLPSILGPTIAPMQPHDGWRPQLGLYSSASDESLDRARCVV